MGGGGFNDPPTLHECPDHPPPGSTLFLTTLPTPTPHIPYKPVWAKRHSRCHVLRGGGISLAYMCFWGAKVAPSHIQAVLPHPWFRRLSGANAFKNTVATFVLWVKSWHLVIKNMVATSREILEPNPDMVALWHLKKPHCCHILIWWPSH
jgi:hypothetical protein